MFISYSVATLEKQEGAIVKAKGVKKCAQSSLRFADYRDVVLLNNLQRRVRQFSLQPKNYQNRLIETNKVAFSSLYDARYLLCAIHSVPYHSKTIREYLRDGSCPLCKEWEEREKLNIRRNLHSIMAPDD